MYIHLLPQLWEALGHYFFTYFSYFFFSFLSEIPTRHILSCLMTLPFLRDLFIYLWFLFFLFPNRIHSIVLSSSLLILSSSCSNMLLTPLVSFSFQSLYFQLENFYFVPLIMPTLYWYSHFIYIPFSWFLLLCLSMVFFSSLTIFRTVDFTSLTNISNDWAPSGMVSVRYISLWIGYAFYSSLCFVISLFRTVHYGILCVFYMYLYTYIYMYLHIFICIYMYFICIYMYFMC